MTEIYLRSAEGYSIAVSVTKDGLEALKERFAENDPLVAVEAENNE